MNQLHSRRAIFSLAVILSLPAGAARAQSIAFSDDDFSPSDWSAELIVNTYSVSASFTAQQRVSGGNPGAYWRTTHTLNGVGGMAVAHLLAGATYDPRSQGRLQSIDYSYDLIHSNSAGTSQVAYRLLILQNGTYYNTANDLTVAPTWTTFGREGVSAADFFVTAGDGPPKPDFSSNGAPMQFGVLTANSSPNPTQGTREHGLDNFSLTLNPGSDSCVYPPAGLVGWWPGDGALVDIAGAHHGSRTGNVGFADAKAEQGFSFDGASQIIVPHDPDFNVQQFTFDAWVRPTSLGDQVEVIASRAPDAGGESQMEFGVRGTESSMGDPPIPTGNFVFFIGGVSGIARQHRGWMDGGGAVPLNQWTHVAVTYDGAVVQVYVNGQLSRQADNVAGSLPVVTGVWKIGSPSDANVAAFPQARFNGLIDEVELLNRALTAEEIRAIYEAGSVGKCRLTTRNAGSFSLEASPDSIVSGFIPGLEGVITLDQAVATPLPTKLGGIDIALIDRQGLERPAQFFFVSPSGDGFDAQANFFISPETAIGMGLTRVRAGEMVIAMGAMALDRVAPGVFTVNCEGTGAPAALYFRYRGSEITEQGYVFDAGSPDCMRPPVPISLGAENEALYVSLYGTGMRNAASVMATLDGEPVPTSTVAALDQFVGLDQLNIGPIPRSFVGRGVVQLILIMGGKIANVVELNFQ